jgi:hypothetical protein
MDFPPEKPMVQSESAFPELSNKWSCQLAIFQKFSILGAISVSRPW